MYIAINQQTEQHRNWSDNPVQKRRELIKYAYLDGTASYNYDDVMIDCIDQVIDSDEFLTDLDWTIMELTPIETEMFQALYPNEFILGVRDNTSIGQLSLF